MNRLGYAMGLVLATLGACGEQRARSTFFTTMPGKGDVPIACPIRDACGHGGEGLPAISLDLPLCAEPGREFARPAVAKADSAAAAQPGCALAATCFPRALKGALRTAAAQQGFGRCAGIDAPHYWFRGGAKPYLLSAQIERVTDRSSTALGRGLVRFEVRRFENGRSTDPRNENPQYFDDRYDRPVYPGDVVVLIPVPADEYWFLGLDEAQFHVTFLRTEMTAAAAPAAERLAAAKPDYYIAELKAEADDDSRTVTFTVKVCNQGGSSDAPIDVELRRASDTAPVCGDDKADYERKLTGMFWEGVQHCRLYSFQQLDAAPGTHAAWAAVDADCAVEELTEENNIAAIGYAVAAPTPPPAEARLTLPELKVHVDGSTVHVRALVCNVGLTPSVPGAKLELWPTTQYGFAERWLTDPAKVWALPALMPVGTTTACTEALTFSVADVTPGNYTAHAKLEGTVHKVDYTVTEPAAAAPATTTEPAAEPATEPATEPAADPAADPSTTAQGSAAPAAAAKADVYVSDISVKVSGDVATFTATVCNHGAQASPPTKLGLFLDVAAPKCGLGIDPDVTWEIPALEQSDCVVKSASTTRPQGSFTASALADAGCAVDEDDEQNNAKNYDYAIGEGNTPPKSAKEAPEDLVPPTEAAPSPGFPSEPAAGVQWNVEDSPSAGAQTAQPAYPPALPGPEATGCQLGAAALPGPEALLLLLLVGLRRRRA